MTTDKTKRETQSPVPGFKSYEEEAAFWDAHSIADFQGEFKTVRAKFSKNLTQTINIRFDPEDLDRLREEADTKGVGPSTLARMWVKERLYGQQH